MFDALLKGASQGLIWVILALGVYISFRLLDFADLSCEGSITLGASISALLIWKNLNPFLTIPISFLAGALAGVMTGLLNTKLKIPPILSGILTMISLYSINIHIMSIATGEPSTSNLSLLTAPGTPLYSYINRFLHLGKDYVSLLFGSVFMIIIMLALYWFFGTEIGATIRATGSNEKMCRAQSINTDFTKILGLAVSNGLIATAGGLLCQYQSFSDVTMGIGSIVIGLASIIIGETIFAKAKNFFVKLIGIAVGTVIYRLVVAFIIFSGMPSTDLKLLTAVVVIIALTITNFNGMFAKLFKSRGKEEKQNA